MDFPPTFLFPDPRLPPEDPNPRGVLAFGEPRDANDDPASNDEDDEGEFRGLRPLGTSDGKLWGGELDGDFEDAPSCCRLEVLTFGGEEEEDLGEMDCNFVCGLEILDDACP